MKVSFNNQSGKSLVQVIRFFRARTNASLREALDVCRPMYNDYDVVDMSRYGYELAETVVHEFEDFGFVFGDKPNKIKKPTTYSVYISRNVNIIQSIRGLRHAFDLSLVDSKHIMDVMRDTNDYVTLNFKCNEYQINVLKKHGFSVMCNSHDHFDNDDLFVI